MAGKQQEVENQKARVLLVDDHPIVRQGLAQLIQQEKGLSVCGEAAGASEALQAIPKTKPDMAIIDISLRDRSGIELIKDIKVRHPDVLMLVISMHDESLYAARALRAGARGYIMKKEAPDELMAAIRRVLNGQLYLSQRMTSKMLLQFAGGSADGASSAVSALSNRELEVFELTGKGLGVCQIAKRLQLAVATVNTHREHIRAKLNLKDASELRQRAIHWLHNERGNSP